MSYYWDIKMKNGLKNQFFMFGKIHIIPKIFDSLNLNGLRVHWCFQIRSILKYLRRANSWGNLKFQTWVQKVLHLCVYVFVWFKRHLWVISTNALPFWLLLSGILKNAHGVIFFLAASESLNIATTRLQLLLNIFYAYLLLVKDIIVRLLQKILKCPNFVND